VNAVVRAGGRTGGGEKGVVLPVKPGLPAIGVDLPGSPALRTIAIHPAAQGAADPPVAYALTDEGLLHRLDQEQGRLIDLGQPLSLILAGDHRLAVLTADGRALLIDPDAAARPRDLETGQAVHLAAGDGFTIVVEADGRGLMIGQRVGATPRRLRLPSGAAPLIASPDGLVISL